MSDTVNSDSDRKKGAEDLVHSSQLIKRIIDSVGDGIYAIDKNENLIFVNKRIARLAGAEPSQMVGKKWWQFFPKIIGTVYEKNLREANLKREFKCFEWKGTYSDTVWEVNVFPFEDGIIVNTRDITEHKKAEEALAESEQKYRTIVETAAEGIAIATPEGKHTFANSKLTQMFGYSIDEALRKSSFDLMFENDKNHRNRVLQARKELENNKISFGELKFRRKDGSVLWTAYNASPMFDSHGKHIANIAMFSDITERKKAEEALKNSEERLNRSQEIAHLGSWELDLKANKLTWSNEVYRIFGLKPQEFGATYEAFLASVHPDDRAAVDAAYSGSLSQGKDSYEIEHRVVRKDNGEIRYVHEKCTHIRDEYGQIVRSLGMVHDITERKKAEEALLQSEERFRSVLNNSLELIYRVNLQTGRYEYMSPSCSGILGFEPEELLGMSNEKVLSRVHPDDLPLLRTELAHIVEAGKGIFVYRFKRKDDQYIWWSNLMVVTKDENGKPLYRDGYGRDITESKKAEEALKESEELFSKAFHSSPSVLAIARTADNCVIDVNEAFLSLLGYSREDAVGHTLKDLNLFPDYGKPQKILDEVLEKGSVCNHELKARTKTGRVLNMLASFEIITLQRERHLLITLVDITDQKIMQKKIEAYTKNLEKLVQERTKQLKDAERLAAIGATAGMVGHDIRNPLQAIVNTLFLAQKEIKETPENEHMKNMKESLDVVEENIFYINKIVADLQDYAKPLNPSIKETDLKVLIDKALTMIQVPKNINQNVKVDDEAKKIMTDPDYLNRIINNLVLNAVQAMPNGGTLSIGVHKDEETSDFLITIEDTGVGIPRAIKDKVFSPMFTTKSKGQGFGLAVVKRMTEALGGTISFESQTGKGTAFTVRLPSPKK